MVWHIRGPEGWSEQHPLPEATNNTNTLGFIRLHRSTCYKGRARAHRNGFKPLWSIMTTATTVLLAAQEFYCH